MATVEYTVTLDDLEKKIHKEIKITEGRIRTIGCYGGVELKEGDTFIEFFSEPYPETHHIEEVACGKKEQNEKEVEAACRGCTGGCGN